MMAKQFNPRLGGGESGLYKLWIVLGLVFLCAEASTLAQWVLSPDFRPSPVGADPLPEGMLRNIRTMEVITVLAMAVTIFQFLIRPLVTRGELTIDGKLVIGMGLCWWLDTLYNYTNFTWYYNAYTLNMGSWLSFVPGQLAPGQETWPEPIVCAGLLWFGSFALFARFASVLYGRYRQAFPRASHLHSACVLFVFCAVLDFFFENAFIRMGVFGFAGVWSPATLWAGTAHQFPLYEPIMYGGALTGLTLFRYYRDDKGQTFCERGIRDLKIGTTAKNLLSAVAVIGFCQSLVLFGWMLPYQWFAVKVDSFPPLASYNRAGVCGKGTERACPDGSFGLPTRNMAQEFVVRPNDPRLSPAALRAQGL